MKMSRAAGRRPLEVEPWAEHRDVEVTEGRARQDRARFIKATLDER